MNRFLVTAFILIFAFISSYAQQDTVKEIEAAVPQLENFHDVIYPIWHTAYPEKDYAALKEYAPEVKAQAEEIYSAKLPGILRDKEAKWTEGVKEFKLSVDNYLASSSLDNNENLLSAAEQLHSKYEALVRIIRPITKEAGEFHKSLYVVYHTYLPNKDYQAIKAISGELTAKAENIIGAKLSKRLEPKQADFDKAAQELLTACAALNEVSLESENGRTIEQAVEKVHARYVDLEKVFE
jgi:hypothetical protein